MKYKSRDKSQKSLINDNLTYPEGDECVLGGLDIEEVEVLDRYLAKDTALQSVGLDVDNFRGIATRL